jgi:ABC-type nitrate/sulfonate/bicarbonate transport system substrate-binding protein
MMRRERTALLVALALAATPLAACGSDEDDEPAGSAPAATTETAAAASEPPASTPAAAATSAADAPTTAAESTAPPPTEKVSIALDWTANANFLGIYAAIAEGYFEQQGIEPTILPYAGTPAEPLIQSGKADLAISYPPDVVINRAQGVEYRAVAGLVAHNTTALAVREGSDYQRPADLSGELYGGFGIQSDKPIITAIMQADGVEQPEFREVVLNTAVIDALAKDRVAYSAVFTGIDDVVAELQGTKLRLFPYRDYLGEAGDYPNAVFVAADETIAEREDALRRTLAALAQGYEFAAANPEEAGEILIEENQSELSKAREIVERTTAATAPMFLDASGAWGRLQDEDFTGLAAILTEGGIVESPPAPSDLYTNELLPEPAG